MHTGVLKIDDKIHQRIKELAQSEGKKLHVALANEVVLLGIEAYLSSKSLPKKVNFENE